MYIRTKITLTTLIGGYRFRGLVTVPVRDQTDGLISMGLTYSLGLTARD